MSAARIRRCERNEPILQEKLFRYEAIEPVFKRTENRNSKCAEVGPALGSERFWKIVEFSGKRSQPISFEFGAPNSP